MFARMALVALVLLAVPGGAQDQPAPSPTPPVYSLNMPVQKIAADPAAAAVLNDDLPGLLSDAQYPLFKSMSLKRVQSASGGDLSEEDVDKTVADLQALPAH